MKKELIQFKKRKSKKKSIIFILFLFCLTIGYAIYTQKLEINGRIEASARFRVYFIEAWVEDPSRGTAIINTAEGADRVTYNVTLNYPGDKVLIGTKIKNDSSIRVKLNDFAASGIPDDSPFDFDYIELDTTNEKLEPGAICDYRFVVSWNENCTDSVSGPLEFSIDLDYEQDTENPGEPYINPLHDHGEGAIHTAFLDVNGGKLNISSIEITNGHAYNLPTPTRTEYTFLGWYTAIESGTKIESADIVDVDDNITLYAIWSWDGHTTTYTAKIDPTCTEDGNVAYYRCLTCGKLYTDANYENEITDVVMPALGHNISLVNAVSPTCEEEGNIAYYKCTRCNKKFSNSEGTNEITDVIIPAFEDSSAATQTTVAAKTIVALGHNFTEEVQSENYLKTTATCTQNGEYYKSCSRCSISSKNITNATFTTAKLAHSYTSKSQTSDYLKQSAQCSGTGVQGQYYYKCATCTASSKGATNTYYSTGTVAHSYQSTTSATNNTAGNNVSHLKSSATCQAKATYYTSCKWCGANSSSTFTSGSTVAHSYTATCSSCNGNGYSWKSANANWYYCYGGGGHCIVVNSCSTHSYTNLSGGYTAIKYCTKCCKNTGSLYYPISRKGSGKQCKWCGTGNKT